MAAKTTDLYNPHEGLVARDGGPYLDQEEARLAEILRAKVEKREPDLDKPPATAGTPLVRAEEVLAAASVNSNPSQAHLNIVTIEVEPASKRAQTSEEKEVAKKEAADNIFGNPANATVVGTDAKAK